MFKKRKFTILIMLSIITLLTPNIVFAKDVTLNKDTINLYALSSDYEEYLEMPSEFKSEEQIILNNATGDITYALKEGNTITIDNNGLVKIKGKTFYCNSSYCTTSYFKNYDYSFTNYEEGTNIVEVSNNNQTFEVTVNTYLYEKYNAEKIMQEYLAENITDNMTDMQKMWKILDLISTTNYSVDYSSYVGLFSANGGDCWASTDAILYMSNLVGVEAHARNAKRDFGAGSGHYNVAALLDGELYIVEGGYNEQAPRPVNILPTYDGFSIPNGNRITQYDGYDENVIIPSQQTTNTLGTNTFIYGLHSKSNIKTVYVPKNITTIEPGAFNDIETLTSIIVEEDNPNYISDDGIVYSKDKTILHSYPAGRKDPIFTIPEGVETLEEYSMAFNYHLEEITFPSSLKTIKKRALYASNGLLGIILPETIEEIQDEALSNGSTPTNLVGIRYVVIKNPQAILGTNLCNETKPIYGLKGSTAEEYAKENNCPFGAITKDQTTFKYLPNSEITISEVEYNENGSIPELTIKDGNYILQENIDYKVTYDNNNKITQMASAEITGIGNYVGFVRKYFKVTPKKIHYTYTNPVVDYNGQIQSPIITTEEDDVTIYYGNNSSSGLSTSLREYKEPGTYKFGARIVGDDYESVYLNDLTFTIKGRDITKATVTGVVDCPFMNAMSTPHVEVKYGDQVLEEDVDYDLSYSDNYYPGTAKVIIRGEGIYEGKIEIPFQIYSKDQYELKMNEENITLGLNGTTTLSIYTEPYVFIGAPFITWKSLNPNIASVNEKGEVTALQKGTATITAKFNGETVSSTVEVVDYLKGDINKDGKINLTDVIQLLKIYLNINPSIEDIITLGDMDNNNTINLSDVIILLKTYLGIY